MVHIDQLPQPFFSAFSKKNNLNLTESHDRSYVMRSKFGEVILIRLKHLKYAESLPCLYLNFRCNTLNTLRSMAPDSYNQKFITPNILRVTDGQVK